jgi:hypothetical protein
MTCKRTKSGVVCTPGEYVMSAETAADVMARMESRSLAAAGSITVLALLAELGQAGDSARHLWSDAYFGSHHGSLRSEW